MKIFVLNIILLFSSFDAMSQRIDSLLKVLNASTAQDSNKINLIVSIATFYEKSGDYEQAMVFSRQGISLSKSLKSQHGEQAFCNILGNCFLDKGELKNALEFHLRTLKLRESLKYEKEIGYSNLNLGNIYLRLNEFEKAIACYTLCKEITQKINDTKVLAICLTSLGSVYGNMGDAKKAEEYFLQAISLQIKNKDESGMSDAYSNLSVLMMDVKNFKESLNYAFKALDLLKGSENKLSLAIAKSNIGDVYCQMKEYTLSIRFQEEALLLSKEMGSLEMIKICSQLLSVSHEKNGDAKIALQYYEQYSNASDSLTNQESNKSISEMKTRFETDKKQKEIELLQKDVSIRDLQLSAQKSNIHRQRIIIFSVAVGILLVIALLLFILKNAKEKKRINIGLERKNIEILVQKNKIEEKNLQITDSIDYAKSIQAAILPDQKELGQAFLEHFIMYQPKELVSGDLYWCYPLANRIYLGVIDCKLHGVPGAFMTVLVYNILEEIMHEGICALPSEIMNQLNKRLITSLLRKNESVFNDYFIEGLILSIDKKDNEIVYSGANSSFVISNKSVTNEYKTDLGHIGKEESVYSDAKVKAISKDTLYLYSDGVKGLANFVELFSDSKNESLEVQQQIFALECAKAQKEDICIVAVRLK